MFGLRHVVILAVSLHAIGIARTEMPAQDGLKFIRVAKALQTGPSWDAVRSSDQHPLYPAAIALVQPVVATFAGDGPDGWRIAAQVVSALASVLLLFPLHMLIRQAFDASTATLGTFLWCVLPLPGQVGHDTLSDPLALLFFTGSIALGVRIGAEDRRGFAVATACGICAGLGFLTRPEVILAPAALIAGRLVGNRRPADLGVMATLGVACLLFVGGYSLAKGQVSEKLALRRLVSGIPSAPKPAGSSAVAVTDKTSRTSEAWSFEPKEESDRPRPSGLLDATLRVFRAWGDGLSWVYLPFVGLGVMVVGSVETRRALAIYAALFAAVLIRHVTILGYLSDRHVLTLMIAALPFAAAGVVRAGQHLRERRPAFNRLGRTPAIVGAVALVAVAVTVQARPMHPSRWGHREAGLWLARHVRADEAVLDTRGWAAFLSGVRAYDPWHSRQAFQDDRLTYLVVGDDERTADSPHGATIRRILATSGEPVAGFPLREGDHAIGVWIYRLRPAEARP